MEAIIPPKDGKEATAAIAARTTTAVQSHLDSNARKRTIRNSSR
jgi:hypothetical protein